MITYIKIDGFKSFTDFEMQFTPLTVIAGSNGSGKSNLFDALRLMADLADTADASLGKAFGKQRGNGTELFTQFADGVFAEKMSFVVEMLVPPVVTDEWGGSEQLRHTRLRYELIIGRGTENQNPFHLRVLHERLTAIRRKDDRWAELIPKKFQEGRIPKLTIGAARHNPYIETQRLGEEVYVRMAQDGGQGEGRQVDAGKMSRTLLSGTDSVRFAHACAARQEISGWRFLSLNTEHLRQPTNKVAGLSHTITSTGKNMAAALYRIQQNDPYVLNDLSRDLANLSTPLSHVTVKDDEARNQYLIEVGSSNGMKHSSHVLSEGTLRLLALSILRYDDQYDGLLCYEEPENGIHPGRMPFLVSVLSRMTVDFTDPQSPLRQVLTNTHSPILIAEALKLEAHAGASVWFTQLASGAIKISGKQYPVRKTYILPVIRQNGDGQASVLAHPISDKLRKLTLHQVNEYLLTNESHTEAFGV